MSETAMDRRDFLLQTVCLGGTFLISCKASRSRVASSSPVPLQKLTPWLSMGADGSIQIVADKLEMGQGVTSLLVGLTADALDVSPERIQYVFAPVDDLYINRKVKATAYNITLTLPVQFTGNSTSTPDAWDNFLVTMMGARAALLAAGARRLGVTAQQVSLRDGFVEAKNGSRTSLAELVNDAARIDMKTLSLEPFTIRRLPSMPRVDLLPKITGTAEFGIDVDASMMGVERLRYAVLVRSPEIGGTVRARNAEALLNRPGVFDIFPVLKGRAIAIVADRYWQARQAAKALEIDVISGPNRSVSSETIIQDYLSLLRGQKAGHKIPLDLGWGAPESIALAAESHKAEYILPYLPHSTLEPMNAACAPTGDGWTVWAPTQFPEAAQAAAALSLNVKQGSVKVVSTLMGGGFGRRLAVDYVSEVAAVALALSQRKGAREAAVKLLWSREEDFQYDYFRPIACHSIAAALDAKGIQAWKQDIATQSVTVYSSADFAASLLPDKLKNKFFISTLSKLSKKVLETVNVDPLAFEGAADTDYSLGRFALNSVGYSPNQVPQIPVGYWRSVGHYHTCFAIESFFDEIALKYGRSEVDLRRTALKDSPRGLKVMERCLSLSGYSSQRGGNTAMGMARHAGWGSFVATVLEVERADTDYFRVRRVWVVVDCGPALQPDIIRQQVEGGVIFALSAALKQEVHIQNGRVTERNFYDSGDILRMHETPEIIIDIISQTQDIKPGGVGELAVPCVAPALTNAVYRLTGKRVRRLPVTRERLQATATGLIFFLSLLFGFLDTKLMAAPRFATGPEALEHLYQLVQHPRCKNCHGVLDAQGQHRPTVGDASLLHPMNISARLPKLGAECFSCHGKQNPKEERLPPGVARPESGVPAWAMPPATMIFATLKNRRELCELWTDPNRNSQMPGQRGSLENLPKLRKEFLHHAEEDPLIQWAFAPGPGRTPALGSKDQLIEAMDVWLRWLESQKSCQE